MITRPFVLIAVAAFAAVAPAAAGSQTRPPAAESTEEIPRYSAEQLDNLVGPIALYPDALLAQVLVAATFPDQVEEAARFVRANGTAGIDDQSWDVSVKAVAHYASALNMMDEKPDWTTTLGRAYANQSADVMAAVQRLRGMAAQQGNLQNTPQQQVITEGNNYVIVPAQPRVIYVPTYDPVIVYTRPVFGVLELRSRYWSFGVGFPIGGWLTYDCDWRGRTVYYNGWNDAYFEYGGGWRARSRPFIQITNIYVGPRYRTVYVNRNVYRRPVNYHNVDRYVGLHRDVHFSDRRGGDWDRGRGYGNDRGPDRGPDRGGSRGPDRGGNDGYTGRTAQPREGGAVATPDGYRQRGGDARGGEPRSRNNEPAFPSREPQAREARPTVTPPESRRSEPSRDMQRGQPPRVSVPRESAPRESRQRESGPRESAPRASAPRDGGERRAMPRGDRGASTGDRGNRGGGARDGGARGRG